MFSQLHETKNKYAVNAWAEGGKKTTLESTCGMQTDRHDSCYMWKVDPAL